MTLSSAEASSCVADHCITCGDDGLPMTVLAVDERRALALCVDRQGARSTVETALVESVIAGDRLLVHAGTAIASLPLQADVTPAGRAAASPTKAIAAPSGSEAVA
jgi:hydrogenase expression/formation protein HypC